MGQTQILMIVLAVIIVGIAVAAGITMFGKSSVTANRDAVVGDCQSVVSQAQQFYKKPTEMGGGGRAFTGLTLAKLNWPASNLNGGYTLTVNNANQITVAGTGVETGVTCSMIYYANGDSTRTTAAP
ncbi:MAG: hypothetical protein EXS64_10835 [Candidatus Latescibacteria bacterium]|nr:hypothetical protein [Candidatus Latescibacterota bacterium]